MRAWSMFRLFVAVVALASVSLAGGGIASGGSNVPGDVNCDDELTILDPLELLKAGAGLEANDDCAGVNADFTCDDEAGVADVPQLLRVIAGLGAETCVPTGTSAGDLIDKALADGDITSDEAVLFKAYYVFGDDRLPAAFDVPHDAETGATSIMKEIGAQYDSLSPAMQQQVGPYLVPPYYLGSWWDLQQQGASAGPLSAPNCMPNFGPTGCPQHPAWSSVSGNLVKVWYPTSFPNGIVHAQGTVSDIENNFWPALHAVMQRTPLSDAGELNNGGDGKLDIAIVPGAEQNFVEPYTPNDCSNEPAFMVITGDTAQSIGTETLIHELMHAFQFAFDVAGDRACSEWDWVSEGTAHWAVRHLRPLEEYGNIPAKQYLNQTEFSMESSSSGGREYGSWIFWYFLSRTNSPDIIRAIWQESESSTDSLVGVNNAIPGGWEEQMPKFAQYAWNRPPGDYFKQWLEFDHQLAGAPAVDIEIGPTGEMRYDATDAPKIEHLSAVYYHFRIAPEVRSIGIHNGLANNLVEYTTESGTLLTPDVGGDVKGLHIWLLTKVDGVWQEPLDWTYYPAAYYCRQVPEERVEEVVLIATNDEFQDRNYEIVPQGLPITVQATDIGCYQWEGTIRQTDDGDGWHETLEGKDLVFERDPAQATVFYGAHVNYVLVSGSFDWELDATQGECTYSGNTSGLLPRLGAHNLFTNNHWLPGPYHRYIAASMSIEELQPYTVNCAGHPPEQAEDFVALSFPLSLTPIELPPGGGVASGTSTEGDRTVTWHLESSP